MSNSPQATYPPSILPATPARHQEMRAFWSLIDVALLLLLLFAASNAPLRFGLGGEFWLLVYGLFVLRIAPVVGQFALVLQQNSVFLAYALVCLASTIWSADFSTTLKTSIQLFATTLFAIYLGWRFSIAALMRMVFLVTSTVVVLSVTQYVTSVFGQPKFAPHGEFLGIFTHKNMLGLASAINLLGAVAMLFEPWGRDRLVKLLALGMAPLALVTLVLAGSVSAISVTLAGIGCFLFVNHFRFSGPIRILLQFSGIAVIGLVPLAFIATGTDPVNLFFDVTGKDRTLTGRTIIWPVAMQVISDNFPTGVGIKAFWSSPQFAYERALIPPDLTSFHNVVLNVLAGTGLFGLVALGVLVGSAVRSAIGLFRIERSTSAAWAIATITLLVLVAMFTTNLYRQHELPMVLVVALGVSARLSIRRHKRRKLAAHPGVVPAIHAG